MSHTHNHHTHDTIKGRNLLVSIILNIIITVSQIVGGILSGSLSLLSDALHNFSDVISLIISYIANTYSKKKASFGKTYGYKRAEIIAAFINAASLLLIATYLIYEAIVRFFNPKVIQSEMVIWFALLGIAVNGFSVLLLRKDAKKNMNIRSAYLHLVTDMSASVAVLVGGLLMKLYNWFWIDSILTILIAVYLLVLGSGLLNKSFKVLMLFTPDDIKLEELSSAITRIPEIKNVHHVHVWQLNEKEIHLEAHLEFYKDITLSVFDGISERVEKLVFNEFGINHVNLQPEYEKDDPKDIIIQD